MRLLRLGAFFGSLVLLVATSVSLINKRAELASDQDARVSAAATTAENAVAATIERARAVVDVAGVETTPETVLASFDESAEVCISSAEGSRCSGPNLMALGSFGSASSQSAAEDGRAVVVVEVASESVLVVARRDATVVLQLPLGAVVGPLDRAAIAQFQTGFTVNTIEGGPDENVSGIRSIDGRRVVVSLVAQPFDEGTIVIRSEVPDDVGIGADSPTLYGALIGLGTVLLGLAGWTFLVERRHLERRATTDELTGLVNRREFERSCEEAIEIADRFGTGLCIMLLDLNGFKQINDTLGHQFGDVVLKECAVRLTDAVRGTDLVGRWGGDEFVALLPGLEESSAVRTSAERIGVRLSSTPVAGDVSITGSIGAAIYPRHGSTLQGLMEAADVAMYEAKTTGVVHRLATTVADESGLPAPVARNYQGPDRRRHSHADDSNGSGPSEPLPAPEQREGAAQG